MAAEQVDLDNVINELLLRLGDHKYRWEVYEYGLTDAVERRCVRAIIDRLQAGVHTGGPVVLGPLGHSLFTARLDGWTPRASPASVDGTGRAVTVLMAPFVTGLGSTTLVRMPVRAADWRLGLNC